MDWVIYTDVLVRAEGFDERHDHWFNINDLLGIIRQSDHYFVMDYGGAIKEQYRKNLAARGWVHRFLDKLINQAKIRYVSGKLTIRLTDRLDSLHFDSDDHIFVAVAHASRGRLVAEESDYTDAVVNFLVAEGVQVIGCEVALNAARA